MSFKCNPCGVGCGAINIETCGGCTADEEDRIEAPPGLDGSTWNVAMSKKNKTSQKKKKADRKIAARNRKDGTTVEVSLQETKTEEINLLDEPEVETDIQAVEEVWDWKEIEAAIDTACVDNVVNPKDFLE